VLELPLLDGRVVGKTRLSRRSKRDSRPENIKVVLENTIETDTEAFAEGIFVLTTSAFILGGRHPIRFDFRFVLR